MSTVSVKTKSHDYDITIDTCFGERLTALTTNKKVVIITDENVIKHHLLDIDDALTIILPPGESTKSFAQFEAVLTKLIEHQLTRKDILIACGGGVIGDLTGFVAACYQRGIPFIQIPTTLLAQVDSSVGGKTAINHPSAKNMIGAFYQPDAVFINLDTLDTLPEREFNAGMAEVIKYGLIADKDFFHWLVEHQHQIKNKDKVILAQMITRCCEIKADVVSKDEHDKGLRQILNFGHTFGHAIETGLQYQYLHGEAVAMGMVEASKISLSRGNITQKEFDAIVALLQSFNLPVTWPENLPFEKAYAIMQRDKKRVNNQMILILLASLGTAEICTDIDDFN